MGPHEDGCRERGRLLSGSPREKNEDITMLHVVNAAAADVMSLSRPRPTIVSTAAADVRFVSQ